MSVACRKVLVTDVNEPLTSERIAEIRAYMQRRLLEGSVQSAPSGCDEVSRSD
jgi:hypothetical protein